MPTSFATILVESCSVDDAVRSFESQGIIFQDGVSRRYFGVQYSVYATPSEVLSPPTLPGVKYDEPFFDIIDVRGFTTTIDLFCPSDALSMQWLAVLADLAALHITKSAASRAIVFGDGLRVPVCMRSRGQSVMLFTQFWGEYFDAFIWRPSPISS